MYKLGKSSTIKYVVLKKVFEWYVTDKLLLNNDITDIPETQLELRENT